MISILASQTKANWYQRIQRIEEYKSTTFDPPPNFQAIEIVMIRLGCSRCFNFVLP